MPPPDLAPPADPWVGLSPDPDANAYLSVYLSSPTARWPVRDVIRLEDNKSDPNLETMTYGLFSTCEPLMRASIVNRRIGEVFFLTNWRGEGRVLTGMYSLRWYARGPLSQAKTDYALAASDVRFIDPIPLTAIGGSAGAATRSKFRLSKMISPDQASELRDLLYATADRTPDYLAEIDRLERFSEFRTGFRYVTWLRETKFSWQLAAPYLTEPDHVHDVANSSESKQWKCLSCGENVRNAARLKLCPHCGVPGSLEPVRSD